MAKSEQPNRTCANPGCAEPASADGTYCERCELEWMLYRRDLRTSGWEGSASARRRSSSP